MKKQNRHHRIFRNILSVGILGLAMAIGMGFLPSAVSQPSYAATVVEGNSAAWIASLPLDTPMVTATSASYTSIKVSWAAIQDADGYRVYRATSSAGPYTYLGTTVITTSTSTGLTTGKTYYYKVIAFRTVDGNRIYSKASAPVYAKPVPARPRCSVFTETSTKAYIAWSGVTGATKYEVFMANSAQGPFTRIYLADASKRNFVKTGLTNGKTYYFKVRAYHMEGADKINGLVSSIQPLVLGSAYKSGTYKVGSDIPAGEYLLIAATDNAQFFASSDASGDNRIRSGSPKPTLYATLKTGEYATFQSLKAYPIAKAPVLSPDSSGTFLPGQYKVGRDIPAGTYVINLQDDTARGRLIVRADSNNLYTSVLVDELYRGRIYITVKTGEYLSFSEGFGYVPGQEPPLDKSQQYLHDGMYLVGTDIPPGTYEIISKDTEWGHCAIYADATLSIGSTIKYSPLSTNLDVTVSEGQYLYVFEGYFAQPII